MGSEVHNNMSAKNIMQDKNFKQLKFKVNYTFNKNEKIKTKFEAGIE